MLPILIYYLLKRFHPVAAGQFARFISKFGKPVLLLVLFAAIALLAFNR
ncbi:MAG: hypothetical protein WDN26_08345 [Chitinophagaceae bacterium]